MSARAKLFGALALAICFAGLELLVLGYRGLNPASFAGVQIGAVLGLGSLVLEINVIERAMVVAKGSVILPEHLPPHIFETRQPVAGDTQRPPELSLEAAEREQILRALQASGGKRIEAARLLGLSRRTLYRKLDRYGIT